jgi:WD40 repeat protein
VVLFYAPSGAGKTSLLNAQVIPVLEEEDFHILPAVRVGSDLPPKIDPQNVPNVFVFSALMGLAGEGTDPQTLTDQTLLSFLRQLCSDTEDDWETRPPILIFDQFEEVMTTHRDRWKDTQGFFEQVRDALQEIPELGVVFAMREDHVAGLDPYAPLLPRRMRARFRMERLDYQGALAAVQNPAQAAGCPFDPGVAEKLVDDLRRIRALRDPYARIPTRQLRKMVVLGPFVEPVQLQVVCNRLWENLPEQECNTIQWEEVEKFGNVDQALTDFYESALSECVQNTEVNERQLRRWFGQQLITPMQTRGLALRGKHRTDGMPNEAVDILEKRHLIRADVRAGARWYELSHDRLVEPILQANSDWEMARQTPLRTAAKHWQETKSEGLLYRDETLTDALAWIEAHPSEVEKYELEFLEASQQAQANFEREQRQNRLIRRLAITATIVSIVAVIAFLFALVQRARANQNAILARQQATLATIRQLVAQSTSVLDTYPQRSLLLALEALHAAQEEGQELAPVAEDTLRHALANAGGRVLSRHSGPVRAVAFSPDSHWLVTGGDDATAQLWDTSLTQAEPILLAGHEKAILAIAFSPDNRWLVTGSSDATARLWDLTAPDPSAESILLTGHSGAINAVAISGNGHWLVTGSSDSTARLWDLTTLLNGNENASPIVLNGHEGAINAIAFSDDDHWLATASADNTAMLWDLTAPDPSAEPVVLRGHTDRVWCVAFSPDLHWLATGSVDATARLWNMNDLSTDPIILRGHEEWVWSIAFSSDNHWLVTSSVDAKPRLWDLTAPDPAATSTILYGHSDQIWSIAISPDNRWLVTGSRDTTARLWDLNAPDPAAASVILRGHESAINAVAISPDNHWLVTGSDDKTTRLWGLTTPTSDGVPMVLRGHTGVIRSVEISSDNHWLVTASGDGTTRVWDLTSDEPAASPTVLAGHEVALHVAVISPKALNSHIHWIATGSADATACLWNLNAPDVAASSIILKGHTSNVRALDISSDGHWLVTGSRDGTARLWDLTAPDPSSNSILLLTDSKAQIRVVAFSPDNRWLVTGGDDRVPRLWDMTGPTPATTSIPLPGHEGTIRAAAFSPDSRWLATGGDDAIPRLWDASAPDPSSTSIELHGHVIETGVIRDIAFSPDSRWLATGSGDNTAILWELTDSGVVKRFILENHNDEVRDVAISHDGHWLLTGSEDGTARLWDLTRDDPTEGSIVLPGHKGPVWRVGFSSDGKWIATGGQDATVRLWTPVPLDEATELACDIAGRNLTLEEWEQYLGDAHYHSTCPRLPSGENTP